MNVSRQYEQTGCNDSYQIRAQYICYSSKPQLVLIYRHNLYIRTDRQKCSGLRLLALGTSASALGGDVRRKSSGRKKSMKSEAVPNELGSRHALREGACR